MPFDGVDRRKHPRRPYLNNIYFCLNPRPDNGTLLGVSTNISDTGICIYTFNPLETGQNILFENELPVPYRRATVQWVKKYHRGFYKAGLLFRKDIPAEDTISSDIAQPEARSAPPVAADAPYEIIGLPFADITEKR